MAITKLPSGAFQARLAGPDGRIHTQVFPTRLDAQEQVLKWKKAKRERRLQRTSTKQLTLDKFFEDWFSNVAGDPKLRGQSGWRKTQYQQYCDYIQPIVGKSRLLEIRPNAVSRVLNEMVKAGRSGQTRLHVYNLLRRMFADAIEDYEYLTFNPVRRKLRPAVPVRETRHLNLEQIRTLLQHVDGKPYGLAIWIQLYLGLRSGELQALRWEDVDVTTGRISIRRTYVRKLGTFRDYPKGGKQHSHAIPKELWDKLAEAKSGCSGMLLVVCSPRGFVLPYERYFRTLRGYCKELGLPAIGTHGLRHSTSELYIHHGASRDDLRSLFAHSSPKLTDRYVHGRGTSLEKVSNVIRLFGSKSTTKTDHATSSEKLVSNVTD